MCILLKGSFRKDPKIPAQVLQKDIYFEYSYRARIQSSLNLFRYLSIDFNQFIHKSLIMKSLLFSLFFSLILFGFGCSSSQSTDATSSTAETPATEEKAEEAPAEETPASGENYTITVLNASKASPRKEMKGTIGGTQVAVNYSSPSVKGRKIWGSLVPNGKVWRTGADEATTIEFSTDVKVEGQDLKAGKYSLFTIPSDGKWTVIFNEVSDQWGAYNYDESKDVLRVEVGTQAAKGMAEAMDFVIQGDAVVLHWENLNVLINISA